MMGSFVINIEKFNPNIDQQPYMVAYEVPGKDQSCAPMTALKALHYINRFIEPIAYDYNCRRGSCGRCAMMIDGAPYLACYFELVDEHTLKPLAGCRVVRDLVVDKDPILEKFITTSEEIKPEEAVNATKPISGEFWRDVISPINACRECMCCYSTCQTLQLYDAENIFLGPGALQQIFLRMVNGVDPVKCVEQAVKGGLLNCVQCGTCTLVCPSRVSCAENIRTMIDVAESREVASRSAD